MTTLTQVAIRLVLSVIAGGLIGMEREVVHKPAGIRTHMLVSLGSALFVLVTIETLPNEAARIIAGIATGIGFLGAGTIFRSKSEVHGLTTAASIWAVSGVGIATLKRLESGKGNCNRLGILSDDNNCSCSGIDSFAAE